MAEYYPLILKAVTALEQSTAQTRRVLYDRARTALLTQLRSVEHALSEPDITRERLALEEAIRRVEVDAVMRQSEADAPAVRGTDPRAAALPGEPDAAPSQSLPRLGQSQWRLDPAAVASPHDDREDSGPARPVTRTAAPPPPEPPPGSVADRWVERERWQTDEPSSPTGRDAKNQYDATATGRPAGAAAPSYPGYPGSRAHAAPVETGRTNEPEPASWSPDWMPGREPAAETGPGVPARRQETPWSFAERGEAPPAPSQDPAASDWWNHANRPPSFEDEDGRGYEPADEDVPGAERHSMAVSPASATPKSRKRIVALGIMALALAAATAASIWKGPGIWIGGIGAAPRGAAEINRSADSVVRSDGGARGKIAERLPTSPQGASESASSAPRAVLFEEDQAAPDGKRFPGSVMWRTESAPAVPGQKPSMTVLADIEIPERRMAIRWSLKRDEDPQSLFSHTIEIMFTVPSDFAHGAVGDVLGILMKQGEDTRGSPLNGPGIKVENNYFLKELLSREGDMQSNIQLLKERPWFDIRIRYADGRQAIVAVEKGSSGERAFAAAFAAWGQ